MKNKKIIGIVVVLVLVASMLVGGGLALSAKSREQAALNSKVDEVLALRDAVSEVVDFEISDDFSSEEKDKLSEKVSSLDETVSKTNEILDDENYCKSRQATCDEIKSSLEKLEIFEKSLSTLLAIYSSELDDNNLASSCDGTSTKVQEMCGSIAELREKVADFVEKYPEDKSLSATERLKMIQEYGEIEEFGDEIEKRYAEIDFAELFDVKSEDITGFFDIVEKLKK